MIFEWCEHKYRTNLEKHDVDFQEAHILWENELIITQDKRFDYKEERFTAFGLLRQRLMICIFTMRDNDTIRIISFRKANKRERELYETERKNSALYSGRTQKNGAE